MRPREIEEPEPRPFGPLGIAILVLHFGLIFWVVGLFFFIGYDLPDFRAAWSERLPLGLTLFSTSLAIVVLLASLTAFEALVSQRHQRSLPLRIIGYGANLLFLASLGGVLYALKAGPLNDDWYETAVQDEQLTSGRSFVGRVIGENAEGCRIDVSKCLLVELHTGDVVAAELEDVSGQYPIGILRSTLDAEGNRSFVREVLEAPGPSEIVYVHQVVGQFSGFAYYEASYTYSTDFPDPELFWRSMLRLRRP